MSDSDDFYRSSKGRDENSTFQRSFSMEGDTTHHRSSSKDKDRGKHKHRSKSSHQETEEGTNHYRSGIFVQSVPRPAPVVYEEKQPAAVPVRASVVREEYRDLHDILVRLNLNVDNNTRAVKMLINYLGFEDIDINAIPRTHPTLVKVRCDVLHVADIDAKNERFQAEVLVHATWYDPDQMKSSGKPQWIPQLSILNMDGTPMEKRKWSGIKDMPNSKYPLHYTFLKLRAYFKGDFDLSRFPIENLLLNVDVSCSVPKSILQLEEDKSQPSTVVRATFGATSQYNLHGHVTCRNRDNASHQGHSVLRFACHASRKPAYYTCGIMLLVFMLSALAFCNYLLPVLLTTQRYMITLAVLLILLAYQLKVTYEIPIPATFTHLGGFMLMNTIFVVAQVVEVASMNIATQVYGGGYAQEADRYLAIIFILIFLCANSIYAGYLGIRYMLNMNAMKEADDYHARRRSEPRYDDRVYYNTQSVNSYEMDKQHKSRHNKHKRRVEPESENEERIMGGDYQNA